MRSIVAVILYRGGSALKIGFYDRVFSWRAYDLKADFHRLRRTLLLSILFAIIDVHSVYVYIHTRVHQILNRKIRSQATKFSKDGGESTKRVCAEGLDLEFGLSQCSQRPNKSLESRVSLFASELKAYLHSASVALPIFDLFR